MPIDPSIALNIQPLQLQSPLAQAGQFAQLQQSQNQNALAQYQLGSAQREEASTNALNEAYKAAYNPATGEIDTNKLRTSLAGGGFGAKLPAIEKGISEAAGAKVKLQKEQSDLVDAKLKQSRSFLDTINPADPNAPAQYIAWHEANHKDPIIGPVLEARGVTADQSRARIQQAINQGPQAFAELLNQSKLGTEKFIEMNKPHLTPQSLGGTAQVLSTPGLGGAATVVPGSNQKVTATPGEIMADKRARDRLAQETATGSWSPESIEFAAQQYAQTGQIPQVGMGNKAMMVRDDITKRASEIARGVNVPTVPGTPTAAPVDTATGVSNMVTAKQDKAAQTSALRDFSSGMSARKLTANNTAINHLDTMEKLAGDLNNADTRIVNAAGNAYATATGSTAPTSFKAARQLVAGEVIKAVVANGGTGGDRKEAIDAFNSANSPAQLKEVINTYKTLLGGQLETLGLQYENGTGRKDFEKKLTPATKKVLQGATAKPAATTDIDTSNPLLK